MNLRCRKPRPLTREEGTYRDDRLFIIATEDTHAPARYFEIFKNPRIKVHVLPTEQGLSAPQHVLERLDKYIREYETKDKIDQFWLMLDTDDWIKPNHIQNFKKVCAEAVKKRFQLAHSNPCFEVWLLLHLTELDASKQFNNADEAISHLKCVLGEYSKRTIDCTRFPPEAARTAVERAKKLDVSPNDRWPQEMGSHVYRIVEKLLPGQRTSQG